MINYLKQVSITIRTDNAKYYMDSSNSVMQFGERVSVLHSRRSLVHIATRNTVPNQSCQGHNLEIILGILREALSAGQVWLEEGGAQKKTYAS